MKRFIGILMVLNGCTTASSNICGSTGRSAYDSYKDTIPNIIGDIVKASGAETAKGANSGIGGSFAVIGTPGHRTGEEAVGNISAFLIRGWGGPDNYKGATLKASHEKLAITSAQYDFFVDKIFVPAILANGVPAQDIACFLGPVTGPRGSSGQQAKTEIVAP